jgi:replication initiation and membrane attachment protein DnaB
MTTKISQDKFLSEVNEMMDDGHTPMESILNFCEKYELEPESVTKFVKNNANLNSKLTLECMELNLIEKRATLPI